MNNTFIRKKFYFLPWVPGRKRVDRGANHLWKAGRDHSCSTKVNEERVSVKPSHSILKNTSIPFVVLRNRFVQQQWQRFIARPGPHQGGKSKEGGETRAPIWGPKTFNGCIHVGSLEGGELKSVADREVIIHWIMPCWP